MSVCPSVINIFPAAKIKISNIYVYIYVYSCSLLNLVSREECSPVHVHVKKKDLTCQVGIENGTNRMKGMLQVQHNSQSIFWTTHKVNFSNTVKDNSVSLFWYLHSIIFQLEKSFFNEKCLMHIPATTIAIFKIIDSIIWRCFPM